MRLPLTEFKNLYNIPDKVIDACFNAGNIHPDVYTLYDIFVELGMSTERWFDSNKNFRKYNYSDKPLYQYDIDYFICKYFYEYEKWCDLYHNTRFHKEITIISRLKTTSKNMCYAQLRNVTDEKDFSLLVKIKGEDRNVTWGKFLRSLPWLYKKTDADYEEMVNIAKSQLIKSFRIREVHHSAIIDWYYKGRYADYNTGSLAQSCMRYSSCEDYLHIYNQDGIRMIIVIDNDDKLVGRAIVWDKKIWNKNYFDDTNAFIDRIYGTDSTIQMVKDYCKTKGYAWKERQSYDCPKTFQYLKDGEIRTIDRNVRVNIETKFDYYPFMDTMFMMNDGYLANQGGGDKLRETDGHTRSNGSCYSCDNELDYDDCHNIDGDSYCGECARYSEYSDQSFVYDDVVWSDRDNDYYHHEDAVYCEYEGDNILHEEAIEDFSGNWIHTDNATNADVSESLIFHDEEFKCFEIFVAVNTPNEVGIYIPYTNGTTQTAFVDSLHRYVKNIGNVVEIKLGDDIIEYDTDQNSVLHIMLDSYIENHVLV